jgi:four helix bundle protein
MRDFKKLKVWQKAMEIIVDVYGLVKSFPSDEKFGLRTQMTRSAISIASNIAEGSAKTSDRDYKRFCETALGSCYELETQMLVVDRIGWVKTEKVMGKIMEEQKMLMAFIDTLGGESARG